MAFFPRCAPETATLPQGAIRLRRGGFGPALVLLHGRPRTHTTWPAAAIAGADLSDLLVTTAFDGIEDPDPAQGKTYLVRTGLTSRPEPRVIL